MLWSVVPEEFILENYDKQNYNWIEAEVNGVKMLVEPTEGQPGYGRIIRLLCPDPAQFLNPKHQPGQNVCLTKGP
ncbi:hypothetical protein CIG75_11700 [Tumebacillus algifaecis]|uniref:YlzJ-like protein n=1 Tax=Tumebacillus algifaecis TaxID=1214604 RepID=A0A223D265_9BACL|nr:YlzJ-like family protein [Tumebacillus algifaecis]ASS75585.1 hypothetical protein CIG75_11700 [Tumebacillus algifaecis]